MSLIISKCNKGGKCIFYNNYKYKLRSNRCTDSYLSWVCAYRTCDLGLKTNLDITEIIWVSDRSHSHEMLTEHDIEKSTIRQAVKERGVQDLRKKPNQLVRQEIRECNTLRMRDIEHLQRSVRYARTSTIGNRPSSLIQAIQQLCNMQSTFRNYKNQPFLYVDEDTKIVIVTCYANVRILADSTVEIFADGTFKYRPKYFSQLYTIHGYKNYLYIPLVYCFLPGKEQGMYTAMWTFLTKIALSMNIDLNPRKITLDFEKAAQNAVTTIFPECEIYGCRFHLGQSWYRKIVEDRNLRSDYMTDSEVGKWLKRFFGLAFLPQNQVYGSFWQIARQPPNPSATVFRDYIFANYICHTSLFPPQMWASEPSTSPRTTNGPESFHSDYNRQFYHVSPSITCVLNVIKEIQSESEIKIRDFQEMQTNPNYQALPQRQSEIDRQAFCTSHYQRFHSGEISLLQYLDIMGQRFYGQNISSD